MSHKEIPNATPSPSEILQQAAGLAEHLQRVGIQWMPAADDGNVAAIKEQIQSQTAEATVDPTSVATTDVPTPVPASETTDRTGSHTPALPGEPKPAAPNASEPAFNLSSAAPAGAQPYPETALDLASRQTKLQVLQQAVETCTRCELLANCRTKTVFGEGNAAPRIVFFGEGPGRDEDLSGRPFVGKAGDLLTKMIQACKFSRDDVYILNTVKCRPPNNRNPEPTEILNCREYFEAQLNTLQPEYIVCLGLISAQALLDTKLSVGRLRGKFHHHFASKVVVTYHPAYLLRNPSAKKAAWDDLQMMLRDAGLL